MLSHELLKDFLVPVHFAGMGFPKTSSSLLVWNRSNLEHSIADMRAGGMPLESRACILELSQKCCDTYYSQAFSGSILADGSSECLFSFSRLGHR